MKKNSILMQDNAPSHASKATEEFLARKGFAGKRLMTWRPSSPDLNPIENLWSVLKSKLYQGIKQYSSLSELWTAIETTSKSLSSEMVQNLTSSMDRRLMKLIECKGHYAKM
jgi:transposase